MQGTTAHLRSSQLIRPSNLQAQQPQPPFKELSESTHITASSPRALTVISIMMPTMMKSIICGPSSARCELIQCRRPYQRTRTTLIQSTTGSDEETSTDGATDRNHLHVSVLELAVQLPRGSGAMLDVDELVAEALGGLVVVGHDLVLFVSVRHFVGVYAGVGDAGKPMGWREGGREVERRGAQGRLCSGQLESMRSRRVQDQTPWDEFATVCFHVDMHVHIDVHVHVHRSCPP